VLLAGKIDDDASYANFLGEHLNEKLRRDFASSLKGPGIGNLVVLDPT
jgi:hypothetical protein